MCCVACKSQIDLARLVFGLCQSVALLERSCMIIEGTGSCDRFNMF
jgi:hypothetical protein